MDHLISFAAGRLIAGAAAHRKPRILGELRIGRGKKAHVEPRSLVGVDQPHVPARSAQANCIVIWGEFGLGHLRTELCLSATAEIDHEWRRPGAEVVGSARKNCEDAEPGTSGMLTIAPHRPEPPGALSMPRCLRYRS